MAVAPTQASGLYWEQFDISDTRFHWAQGLIEYQFTLRNNEKKIIKITTEWSFRTDQQRSSSFGLRFHFVQRQKSLWPPDDIALPGSGLPCTLFQVYIVPTSDCV